MLRTAIVLSFFAMLPGCVVWEIRDEMRGVNTRLDVVDASLTEVNDELTDIEVQLSDVRGSIEETNTYLDTVYGGLDDTNTSLEDMQERLSLLRSVQTSLTNIDTHLASLRKTINRIDGAIPFLSLGGDEVIESPAPPDPSAPPVPAEGGGSDAVAANGAEAGDAPAATQPARQRIDPLVGVWMSAQPSDGSTLVLQPGNEYMLSRTDDLGVTVRERGGWERSGSTITLNSTDGPATSWTILLQTTRSLTVDNGEQIRVLVKP
jgi:hypothetical protein